MAPACLARVVYVIFYFVYFVSSLPVFRSVSVDVIHQLTRANAKKKKAFL